MCWACLDPLHLNLPPADQDVTYVSDEQALFSGYTWANIHPDQTGPVIITYSFVETPDLIPIEASPYEVSAFYSFDEAQRANFRLALTEFSSVAGFVFVETTGPSMIAAYRAEGSPWGGWAYYPASDPNYTSTSDLVVDDSGSFAPGSFAYQTLMHELGHAVGLKHPFEGEIQLLPELLLATETVMSYDFSVTPVDLGPLDIAAIQTLYGPAVDTTGWVLVAGADSFFASGSDRPDVIAGVNLANAILGLGGDDTLVGRHLDDTLTGGAGTDLLVGNGGNDLYVIDDDDEIFEDADGGNDTVQSSVSFTLAENFETLVLTGTAASGTGNTGANRITGNGSANTLNGGGGTDTLEGGAGDDIYITDGSDTLTEGGGGGADTVRSSVNHTLGLNLETLVLTGTAAIGTGNSGANRITGNGSANTLNGSGGVDILAGLGGNDTYVTDGGDTITETATGGRDTVRSGASLTLGQSLEVLVLTGAANLNGTGNGGANSITGNGGRNVLNGGLGLDTLVGGAGQDAFVFNTALSAGNIDRITAFRAVDDTIRLENAVFTVLTNGALAGTAFARNITGTAGDASDRIIYETDTGKLFFDRDGTGAAARVQFAVLEPNITLAAGDFLVT